MIFPSIRSFAAWAGFSDFAYSLLLMALLCLFWETPVPAAAPASEEKKLTFNIPADKAAQSLKKFSAQSGQQLLYSNNDLAGVTTNEVKGAFTSEEALTRLLAGTPLVATRDLPNGAVAVGRETNDPND